MGDLYAMLNKLQIKELTPLLQEYGLPEDTFESKTEIVNALVQVMKIEEDQNQRIVQTNLPELFRQFLERKDFLNTIRGNIGQVLRQNYFVEHDEFRESCKYLEDMEHKMHDNICRIMVFGNNSSGKSLFLNLIMGSEVLPYTALPCTSVICEIQSGEKKWFKVVDFAGNVVVDQSLEIPDKSPMEILKPYLWIEGRDRQEPSRYKTVHISWPTPLLDAGIVLVDTPGLEENPTMTELVDTYIERATALICVVDSTQGAITDSLRKTLKRVSLDTTERRDHRQHVGIHRDAVFFVCNKWDLVDKNQREEVFANIKNGARKFWSLDVKDSQFIPMDTLTAFKARIDQRRDNMDAKRLKKALLSFLEQAFYFKLHYLWFNVNSSCLRAYRVSRMQWNLANKTDASRRQMTDEARTRLQRLNDYVRDDALLKEMMKTYEQHFKTAEQQLETFLISNGCWDLFQNWATKLNIEPANYPRQLEEKFEEYLKEVVFNWEEENGYFRKAQSESKKHIAKVVLNIERQRSRAGAMISGPSEESVDEYGLMGIFARHSVAENILICVTASIWLPLAIVGSPIALLTYAIATGRAKNIEQGKREAYTKDRTRQKLEDTRRYFQEISVSSLTKKMFGNAEEFMKQVVAGLRKRIIADMKLLEKIDSEESQTQFSKQQFGQVVKLMEEVVGAVRTFYIENLRKDTIDKSNLKVYEQIGVGSSAVVYRGEYGDQPVAIKVLTTQDTNTINAFFQEEEVLLSLRHPNILRFFGSLIETGQNGLMSFSIVTALADCTLRQFIDRSPPLTAAVKMKLIIQLAEAVQYMHNCDYIHRDLKPENILIQNGEIRVADVGLTRKKVEVTGTLTGTPLYMAPEILWFEYDVRVDVYSFGRIMWEIWFLQSCEPLFPLTGNYLQGISSGFDLPHSRPSRENPPPQLCELFDLCCKLIKDERPTFEGILRTLREVRC